MTCRLVVSVMLAVGLLASAAGAAPPAEQLEALTRSDGYRNNIARLFAQLPPAVFQRCAALVSAGSQVTVIEPVSFAPDGYPIAGLWKQSFPVSGCGNDTTINFFFRGQADEKILSIFAVPGATHANPTLQRDALRLVNTAVLARAPGCSRIDVRDSRYDGVVDQARRAWQETWSVASCQHATDVTLTFTPDATGTTVRVAAPEASISQK